MPTHKTNKKKGSLPESHSNNESHSHSEKSKKDGSATMNSNTNTTTTPRIYQRIEESTRRGSAFPTHVAPDSILLRSQNASQTRCESLSASITSKGGTRTEANHSILSERLFHEIPLKLETTRDANSVETPHNITSSRRRNLVHSTQSNSISPSMGEKSKSQGTNKKKNQKKTTRKGKGRSPSPRIPPQHMEETLTEKPTHLPPVIAQKAKRGGWLRFGWLNSLLSLMFRWEEFGESGENGENGENQPTREESPDVTPVEMQTFRVVDRLVPSFAKQPAFYVLDFFTHRRVMLVLLTIAILLGYFNFQEEFSSLTASFIVADKNRPGLHFLDNHTIRRKHPVMIVPGFISTALEVWEERLECIDAQRSFISDFRQRMFGPRLLFLLITDPACYLQLFSLDKRTGSDPPGVKVRPDMGFGSSDFFLPGYWVWAKVLINLADIGYDPQSMSIASYDWRLSPRKMHQRDGYFYYLKSNVQFLFEKNKERVVIISHSYGSNVMIEFFNWAEKHQPGWMDKHVAYWINVGGPLLGVAKSVSAVLAGEAKDTLTLPRAARHILESHMASGLRTETMRTWSCLLSMYPRGCDSIWPGILALANGTKLTAKQVLEFTAKRLEESGHVYQTMYVHQLLREYVGLPSLPKTQKTSVVCLYGVGKETETGYALSEDGGVNDTYPQLEEEKNGVLLGNGDGTVPLMSLGYMCRAENGWKKSVGRVITREHNHILSSSMNLRGGSSSGDHVDILGNHELIETILKIVTGNAENKALQDRIISDIDKHIKASKDCLAK